MERYFRGASIFLLCMCLISCQTLTNDALKAAIPPSKESISQHIKSFEVPDAKTDPEIYPIYFGTTRQLSPGNTFNDERGKSIQYGLVNVRVPIHRDRGSLGTLPGTIFRYNQLVKIYGKPQLYNDNLEFRV